MGEVYRARDTQLNRDVAIKVLPELFALDHERLARFTREAQTLAALNHPNIAQIYGLEGQGPSTGSEQAPGSVRALVMELVEGEDLSTLIERGPLPLPEALPIARQIADALEAAHELGIVHRDLKPANIKVRGDGTVKVLDFGLAKAMDPAGTSSADAMKSPTLTARATQMGMIIGTAAYMAPEQAKGKAVDKRADIWAFGIVLYEMLTGRRAFEGDDISTTIAAVLMRDPEWAALPDATPPALRSLIRRCAERDPKAAAGHWRSPIASEQSGGDARPAGADGHYRRAVATVAGALDRRCSLRSARNRVWRALGDRTADIRRSHRSVAGAARRPFNPRGVRALTGRAASRHGSRTQRNRRRVAVGTRPGEWRSGQAPGH
jgi:hypothetical protein